MSVLDYFLDGLLISKERLMQAREFYAPSRSPMPAEMEFARWTQRIAVQNELGTAREMAGLTDAQLDVLEGEFIRCPTRLRSAWARHGVWVGALLIAMACTVFAATHLAGMEAGAIGALTMLGAGALLIGTAGIAISGLTAFSALQLDVNYGNAGLYVGLLDEQHPWLYKTMGLLRHEAAESYRQSVLSERGSLRGLDYLIMREVVAAHESLDRMRPARAVAEQLQRRAMPIETVPTEPRLIQVGSGNPCRSSKNPGRGGLSLRCWGAAT